MFKFLSTVAIVCNLYGGAHRCESNVKIPQVVHVQIGNWQCTGFVAKAGYVVTANHCFAGQASAKVTFYDGSVETFVVKAHGDQYGEDYAILQGRTGGITPFQLSFAPPKDKTKCHIVGYTGTPSQHLTYCEVVGGRTYYGLYSMFAEVLPGDSGSPVISDNGEVIGIATRSQFPNATYGEFVEIKHVREAFRKLGQ